MTGGTDIGRLRDLVSEAAGYLTICTHDTIGEACAALGLPEPPRQAKADSEQGLTKRQRVAWSLARLADEDVPVVADRILDGRLPTALDAATRNAIEDVLWAGQGVLEIPRRTRRDIARAVDLDDVMAKPDRFMALLDRLWVLGSDPFEFLTGTMSSLRRQIEQHVLRNPGDWTAERLFDELGAIDSAGDARFARFLEGLASAAVVPDEDAQRRIVAAVNPHLRAAGAELRETGDDGGYPVFTVTSTRAARGRPKNLIFASQVKPDIRITDAIDNDIEIVSNADDVLVYDRPTHGGVLWRDLQAWWRETRQSADDAEAKSTLYKRLRDCLPESSPPQRNLFDIYHHIHRDELPDLPALLPEVWLHWDPRTARERGPQALLSFRMDFLLLLPHGHRIVLEVDGATHYSTGGRPDPAVYAKGARADRDLKLARYEVFRFGATELQDPRNAEPMLRQFLTDLFRQFDVTPRAA
jgi:very-short-patch-repair endonuclease